MVEITGGCLCGAVRYEVSGEPVRIINCHCDDCRKTTGAAFATNVFFKEADITILQGTPKSFQHTADSGATMTKEFCDQCGSQIFGKGSRGVGVKSVRAGTIDDPSSVIPSLDIYIARKLPGVILSDETEHHAEMRPMS